MINFEPWPKIRRDNLNMYVTEKIDGTNACVRIYLKDEEVEGIPVAETDEYKMYTQSRKRWITPEDDNMGFSGWVKENSEELFKLGHGSHYGEWAGLGIQKNPHELDNKYFYLFNHHRWGDAYEFMLKGYENNFPKCTHVVPFLYNGDYEASKIDEIMSTLKFKGSTIGGTPEGIIVYVPQADHYQKVTFEHSKGKWRDEQTNSI